MTSKKPAGKPAAPKEAPKAKETVPGWAEGGLPEGGTPVLGFYEGPEAAIPLEKMTAKKADEAPKEPDKAPEAPEKEEKAPSEAPKEPEKAPKEPEKAVEMPKKVLEKPPAPPERAEGGADPLPDTRKPEIRAALVEILNIQKGKRDIPTEVKYYSKYARADRVVIIDVNVNLLDEAWRKYCSMDPEADPEIFLATVYSILKLEVPRMYRAVATLRLC